MKLVLAADFLGRTVAAYSRLTLTSPGPVTSSVGPNTLTLPTTKNDLLLIILKKKDFCELM